MELKYIAVVLFAFFFEFTDTALGMGYGTGLTPVLLLMGFPPLSIIPAVVFSQFITSLTAAFFHHRFDNVDLRPKSDAFRIAVVLMLPGIVGTILAVLLAVKLPAEYLKVYIGALVLVSGLLILINGRRSFRFSWLRIAAVGGIAGFNKGISGGSYGPVTTAGQVLSGVKSHNAVGIVSLAEGIVCFVAFVVFLLTKGINAGELIPYTLGGAMFAIPIAAWATKKLPASILKGAIGVFTVLLGVLVLIGIN